MNARPPLDPDQRRRMVSRAGGWASLAAGLFLAANAGAVVVAGAAISQEAPVLIAALLLLGLGVWLLRRAGGKG